MKLKTAALILLVSSILWLADMIYYTFNHFFGENAKYYAGHPVDNIISTIFMVVPVSFIIFSITLYRRKPGNIPAQPVDDDARGVLDIETPNMTVGEWLATFFITLIPFFGLVFLIIWASDNNKPIRKTWAVAMLIWSLVVIALAVILVLWVRSTTLF